MATWSQYDKDMRGIKQKPEVIMKRKKKWSNVLFTPPNEIYHTYFNRKISSF